MQGCCSRMGLSADSVQTQSHHTPLLSACQRTPSHCPGLPRKPTANRSFVTERKPQERPSFQPARPLLTHHGEKFNVSNISPLPLSPNQPAISKSPQEMLSVEEKEVSSLDPLRGTVCPRLTTTTIFICFSKLSVINTRRLWLQAEQEQKADLERAFRFLR